MPVVLRHNDSLELNLAEYFGSVTYDELKAVAAFLAANPLFLKRDCLSVARQGCNFDTIELEDLDTLFGGYTTLYAPITFQIIRRSAWACLSPSAQRYVDHWIIGRDARGAMSTTLRQFPSYEEAGDWLVLSEAETLALQTRAGFDVVATFEDKPEAAQACAR